MTLLHADGFDMYDDVTDVISSGWARENSSPIYTTTGGRFGGGALTYNSISQFYWSYGGLNIALDSTTIVELAHFHNGAGGVNNPLMAFYNSNGNLIGELDFSPGGAMRFESQTGVVTNTSGSPLTANQWNWVEIKFVNGSTAANGSCIVRVNGVEVINAAAQDTNSGAHTLGEARFWGTSTNGVKIDDFLILNTAGSVNNDFTGDLRIDTLRPTADGAVVDWTANTGADFAAVDDPNNASDGDTTYIFSNTPTQKSRFAMGDVAGTAVSTKAVQVRAKAKKTDAGASTYRSYIRSVATEANGATIAPTTTYAWHRNQIQELNPNGSVAWTDASVNAMEVGVELVS